MPHVNIKHFPVQLELKQTKELAHNLAEIIARAFGCDVQAVSVALEPISLQDWDEQVYRPEIVGRCQLLAKPPHYSDQLNAELVNSGASS